MRDKEMCCVKDDLDKKKAGFHRVEGEKKEVWQSNVRHALHQCCYFTAQIPKHKCKHMSVLSYIWTVICLVFSSYSSVA